MGTYAKVRLNRVAALFMMAIVFLSVPCPAPVWGEETFGTDAVWHPPGTVMRRIGEACPQGGACFIEEMIKAGASAPAVNFTRFLQENDYPFCFMRSFQAMGKVGIVRVDCPFMANTMGYTLLVNGSPAIFRFGDKPYLDALNLKKDPRFTALLRKYARADIWPDGAFVAMQQLTDEGQRFIWKHKLLNGCRACEFAGLAVVAYDFDRHGRFCGVKLLTIQGN